MLRSTAGATAIAAAAALVLVGTAGIVRGHDAGSGGADTGRYRVLAADAAAADGQVGKPTLAGTIETLQTHLGVQPNDERSWAGLGVAYVEQARVTLNPTYYPKAQTALDRALALAPADDAAHAGLAALDSARHDFRGALAEADRALAVNPDSAQALAIRIDALTELGMYPQALAAATAADARTPGVPIFTRLSYQRELRGDVPGAVELMERALQASTAATDIAFVETHLGDLARETGQLAAATVDYAAALKADPTTVAATAGQARLASLRGDDPAAIALWTDVVRRAPLPEYLVDFGDLLESLGMRTQAEEQFAVVVGSAALARANGVQTDLEIANFESDHGDPQAALTAARAEWGRRHSVLVADAYAWALHAAGLDAQALALSRLALSLGTADARLLLHAAVIEHDLGLDTAARSHLAGAQRLRGMLDPLQRQVADRLVTALAKAPAGARS
jgi:tetratricopeptide (TPR) repeat protein